MFGPGTLLQIRRNGHAQRSAPPIRLEGRYVEQEGARGIGDDRGQEGETGRRWLRLANRGVEEGRGLAEDDANGQGLYCSVGGEVVEELEGRELEPCALRLQLVRDDCLDYGEDGAKEG